VRLETQLRDLPRQSLELPPPDLWSRTETLLRDYVTTTVKLVQVEPLALFAGLPPGGPLPPLTFTRFSERTRQTLYAATVATHWDAPREHEDDFTPDYSPAAAGLQVVYVFGRWFAIWRQLEEPHDIPPAQRWQILTIEMDPTAPHGISFTGV
jgi:hypothetical protein